MHNLAYKVGWTVYGYQGYIISFSSYTARERAAYGKVQLPHMVRGTMYSAVEGPEGPIKGEQVNMGHPIT